MNDEDRMTSDFFFELWRLMLPWDLDLGPWNFIEESD